MKLHDMKIGTRLTWGFSLILALLVIVTFLGILGMTKIADHMERIVEVNYEKIRLAQSVGHNIGGISAAMQHMMIFKDPVARQAEFAKVEKMRADYLDNLEGIKKLEQNEEGKKAIENVETAIATAKKANSDIIELAMDGSIEEAAAVYVKEGQPVAENIDKAVKALIKYNEGRIHYRYEAAVKAVKSTEIFTIIISIMAIVIGAFVGVTLTRMITRPLQQAVTVAGRVASGDLTAQIVVETKDETGELMQALKEMNESLVTLVGDVRESSDSIATATRQIASGNSDLSQRTEEQASALEETASSMEELTSTVKQNADNAQQANQLAVAANDVAIKGGEVIGRVITTMDSITQSSKKIADIISVIDGIAFQTNILALNAAVEAARAGEQGRGFAVVAGEVRNLAQRSAAAAKEIKSLIGDSVEKVEDGANLVSEAGQTIQNVVSSVKKVTNIMAEITAASVEQSSGIEQVNQAITQMDEVTQQNASLVEEAAAAAESLEEQAQNLVDFMSRFKITAATMRSDARENRKQSSHFAEVAHAAAGYKPKTVKKNAIAARKASDSPRMAKASGHDDEWQEF